MKITLFLELEVDIDGWADEYDIEPTVAAVLKDVTTYFRSQDLIPEHLTNIVKVL